MTRTTVSMLVAAAALATTVPHAEGETTRVFSSYLGGPGGEFWVDSRIAGAAVAPDGTLLVAGDTADVTFGAAATDLRTAGGGVRDLFVARISADGATLLKLTFLGGNGRDDRATLAVAPDGSVVLTARTLVDESRRHRGRRADRAWGGHGRVGGDSPSRTHLGHVPVVSRRDRRRISQ